MAIALAGCSGQSQSEKKSGHQASEPLKITELKLDVKGMTCDGCENAIIRSLDRLDGVIETHASHEDELVTVKYDAAVLDAEQIKEGITRVGYTVAGQIENE